MSPPRVRDLFEDLVVGARLLRHLPGFLRHSAT
jgi:hypothetical protein